MLVMLEERIIIEEEEADMEVIIINLSVRCVEELAMRLYIVIIGLIKISMANLIIIIKAVETVRDKQ